MNLRLPLRSLAFALFIAFIPIPSWGLGLQFGTGFSSFTSGRTIPALNVGITFDTLGFFGSTTGTRSELFYGSHHALSMQWLWSQGLFAGSKIRAGAGFGGFLSERGYRETTNADLEKTQDSAVGFAFSVQWNPFDWVFLRGESIFGIGSVTRALALSFQDSTLVSLGVEF